MTTHEAATHEAAKEICRLERELATKARSWRHAAGIPNGCLYITSDDHAKSAAVREYRAMGAEASAALATAHAVLCEARARQVTAEAARWEATHTGKFSSLTLQAMRDEITADIYRRTATELLELARLTRLRAPAEVLGCYVLEDQIAASASVGLENSATVEWPVLPANGVITTQRWLITNVIPLGNVDAYQRLPEFA